MHSKKLLKFAAEFAEMTQNLHDPFWFFNPPADTNDAKDKSHPMQRALERGENPEVIKESKKFAENLLANLYGKFPNEVRLLPEGSEWFQPAAGNLVAIFKKKNNQLILVTFLDSEQKKPKTINGKLEDEIKRLYNKYNKY